MSLSDLIQGTGILPLPRTADFADSAEKPLEITGGAGFTISSSRLPRADGCENQNQHTSAVRQQSSETTKTTGYKASKGFSAKSAGSAEIEESETPRRWPVVVNTLPGPEDDNPAIPDYRVRCADCARLNLPYKRCTASNTPYHPHPDILRHCPDFVSLPKQR